MSLSIEVKHNGKLWRRITNAVRDRIKLSKAQLSKRHEEWIKAEERTLAYLPERDIDALRRSVREGGKPQYTTIQIPYSYSVLMSAHTYWTTVFMSRTPILQYSGRHGETEQQIQALEAIIDYQLTVGRMMVPLYIWLLDVGKYGVGIVGNYWDDVVSTISEIIEEPQLILGIDTGRTKRTKKTRKVPGYSGNRLYNIRPFDFFPDPRVPLHRFQEGEYCAVYNELGWNQVLRRKEEGTYINIDQLRKGGNTGGHAGGGRVAGSSQLELPDDSGGISIFDRKPSDVVKFFEMAIELVPNEWGLGKGDVPEKWMFTVTDDYTVVIGAQPLGWMHDRFPYEVIEFEPEGYALANRSISEILKPVQETMDWLINAHFYNVRKVLNDQFVVDPSRVVMKDVMDPLPGGIIRLTPAAYGTDPKIALQQLQVVDVTQNHLRDMKEMLTIGERASGVNDQLMGLLQRGGRRTAQEVRTSSSFGINRLKTTAEYFSMMGWGPLSQMLVQNTQQMYDAEQKFKIVGDLAQEAGQQFLQVDQSMIQGFFDFVPVDGTLPVDRFAQANLWRELFSQMSAVPELMAQYDIGRIFAWVAQLAGLKNINRFKIDVQPDAALATQAERGNIVPLGGSERNLETVPEPGQVSGLGTSG
jgi:hypothetical protein